MLAEIGSELLIILILTLANGFFAASEIALVSARKGRLEGEAASGSRGARQALTLQENPDRFLATVQIGITLISTFSAAFGGARISTVLTASFNTIPTLAPYAGPLSLGLVVTLITFLSLLVGELIPKQLALSNAERLAIVAAPLMTATQTIARPLVWFLTVIVNGVLRLLGAHKTADGLVTTDDIIHMVREGAEGGTVEAGEASIINRVFHFSDRPVRAIMTPRNRITALPVTASLTEATRLFGDTGYSRLPLYEDNLDQAVGVLNIKDVMTALTAPAGTAPPTLQEIMRPIQFVVQNTSGDDVMIQLREKHQHIALVIDEYGQIIGLVTLEDLLEELVGEIQDEYDEEEDPYTRREDGSWLIDGIEPYDRVCERLSLPDQPTPHHLTTLAGVMLSLINRLPTEGDTVELGDYLLEVIDMDGRRIDKVLVRLKPPAEVPAAGGEGVGEIT